MKKAEEKQQSPNIQQFLQASAAAGGEVERSCSPVGRKNIADRNTPTREHRNRKEKSTQYVDWEFQPILEALDSRVHQKNRSND